MGHGGLPGGHGHGHDHDHDHDDRFAPPADASVSAYVWGIGLNLGYVVVEAACAWWSNSVALAADAVHNFSDVLGLVVSLIAIRLARCEPTERRTYGLKRGTVLAAFANALILFGAVGGIAVEAAHRLTAHEPVVPTVVMVAAAIGAVVNLASACFFLPHAHHGELNARGAWLHLAGDAAISVVVAASGLVLLWIDLPWLDPALSIFVALVILWGAWGLFRESLDLLLDAVPRRIAMPELSGFLGSYPHVAAVHDLHVWGISTTETALSAHLVTTRGHLDDEWLQALRSELASRFGIGHSTIQLERAGCGDDCQSAAGTGANAPPAA